ncbi:MAG TPA: prepilin-type N-terminal cleavage/methylation domain-containing protein [Acidimicrobiales bacterium]|nr:prepilin-type N-terminal cleavage/methylation domain-containing protein [Acidimicrobiales bacterium]
MTRAMTASGVGRYRARWRRSRGYSDEGMTLVEVLVAMGVFMILMTFTATMINNFYGNSSKVQNSYSAFTQVLPASTAIEQFFRTIVEPAPSNGGQPVPAVSPTGPGGTSACPTTNFYLGPNCIQFTSNQGNANGPSLVTATTTANTTPAGTYTLTMTVQDPTAHTCPGSSTNPNFVSPYTSATRCQYAASATRRVLQITNLTNGSPTATSPVFQYTLGTSTSPVPYSTAAGSSWVTNFGATSCTAASCPVATIQTLTLDIEAQTANGFPASYQTQISTLSPLYSSFVG